MANENEFSVSERVLRLVDDPKAALKVFLDENLLQSDMGLSNDELGRHFYKGVDLFERGRFEEAADIFTLLVTVRPEIPNFWIGLGSTLQGMEDYGKALRAFKMAIFADSRLISSYIHAARCCITVRDFEHALEILEVGLEQVSGESASEDFAEAAADAQAIRAYILALASE